MSRFESWLGSQAGWHRTARGCDSLCAALPHSYLVHHLKSPAALLLIPVAVFFAAVGFAVVFSSTSQPAPARELPVVAVKLEVQPGEPRPPQPAVGGPDFAPPPVEQATLPVIGLAPPADEPVAVAGDLLAGERLAERVDPALMEARIFAFAAAIVPEPLPAPAVDPPPAAPPAPAPATPASAAGCTLEGSRPPANPPRVFRADGTVLVPDYVEYRDAMNRLWVWDGTNWTDKATGRSAGGPPC